MLIIVRLVLSRNVGHDHSVRYCVRCSRVWNHSSNELYQIGDSIAVNITSVSYEAIATIPPKGCGFIFMTVKITEIYRDVKDPASVRDHFNVSDLACSEARVVHGEN